MIDLRNKYRTCILSIVAIFLATAVCQTTALGESSALKVQSTCDVCHPEYWVVSSRHCCQQFSSCSACNCPFNYHRYLHSGRIEQSTKNHFLKSIDPDVPVCFMAHGSFVDWEGVKYDSLQTARWIRRAAPNRRIQIVFYTWPSNSTVFPIPQFTIDMLGNRAEHNGYLLARLVCSLPNNRRISFLGHSHGARLITAALHLLGGGNVNGLSFPCSNKNTQRYRVVLAAAAIDHHWLNPGERYGCTLSRTEALLTFRNRKDFILGFYPLRRPFSSRALDRTGFTAKDYYKLGNLADKTCVLDVDHLVGSRHMWPNYYSHDSIASAMVPYLYYDEAKQKMSVLTPAPAAKTTTSATSEPSRRKTR